MTSSRKLSDLGVAGLCLAGRTLALRLAELGLRVSLWDISAGIVEEFVAHYAGSRGGLVGYVDCGDFVESLNAPRRIVVFETAAGPLAGALRALLGDADRLLEYPLREEDVPCDDLAQLEMALVFQMA
jgi:6-phosphogluconate dehydrogenase